MDENGKDYLQSLKGIQLELPYLLDAVSGMQGDFFENKDFLKSNLHRAIKILLASEETGQLGVWVLGCSTGEEAYSVAILLEEYPEDFDYYILGTDISEEDLDVARKAIYDEKKIDVMERDLKEKYFLRKKDQQSTQVRLMPEIRSKVSFRQLNYARDFSLREEMSLAVCRNTLSYFNKTIQEGLIYKFCTFLHSGAFFLTGISEDISGMRVPLVFESEGLYRRE